MRCACLVALAASTLLPAWATAECFADLSGGDGAFTARINSAPKAAIADLLAMRKAAAADPDANPSAAHIDAILMEAYFTVSDIPHALESATLGLSSLVPSDSVGLQRRLQFRRLVLLNANGQVRQAAAAIEADAAGVPEDAPELLCVLTVRGYLRLRTDHVAAAASDLMRAAALAHRWHAEPYRFEATGVLSMLYARDGFYADAMALANESIAYFHDGSDKLRLTDAYFRRGDVYLESGSYRQAEPDFAKVIAISRETGDAFDVMAGEQRMCRVLAHLPDRPDALQYCADAYAHAQPKVSEQAKLELASLGEIELAAQHPAEAVAYFNRALSEDGADIPARSQNEIRRQRGRARQMLGDSAGALQDMIEVVAGMDRERQSSTAERVSLLHVKTELEEKDRELSRARASEVAAMHEASRQALLRNLIAVVAVVGLAAILSIAWLLRRRGQIDAARLAAEARLTAIGKLTGGIAHEFNNRLTVIQQAAWLLAHRPALSSDPQSTELITEIERSTRASADITAQLLSFSRQQHLSPCVVHMAVFLREILPTLQRIAAPALAVSVDVSDTVPPVWVDPRQLTAALLNLAANSRDAVGRGGTLTIRVTPDPGSRIRMDIVDNGCGMTPQVLARATDPFFTTKAVGAGSGLGLSMVEGFVRQSGGEMHLRSEPGIGTTVTLLLPVAMI